MCSLKTIKNTYLRYLCNFRYLEFEEFCQLSAKFLIEEDEEGMKRELKEAFRIYDKAGTCFSINHFVCYTIGYFESSRNGRAGYLKNINF